jgi:hypothetical protein
MTSSFVPPLRLAGTPAVYISSLEDATGILRDYIGRRPRTRDLILRRVVGAGTEEETRDAAKSFRWWAEQEGLLYQP